MARTGQAYSTAIADSINAFLKEDEWRFDFDSERGRFIFNLGLSCKLKSVRYIVDVRERDYLIYVFSPLGPDKGDAATMKRTAEFLTRANYGLVFGNFEMDMHDGEIRYKTFVPCGGEAPCADVIRRSIYVPAMMLDRYGDGLLKVLYSDIDPEKACSMCENDLETARTTTPKNRTARTTVRQTFCRGFRHIFQAIQAIQRMNNPFRTELLSASP